MNSFSSKDSVLRHDKCWLKTEANPSVLNGNNFEDRPKIGGVLLGEPLRKPKCKDIFMDEAPCVSSLKMETLETRKTEEASTPHLTIKKEVVKSMDNVEEDEELNSTEVDCSTIEFLQTNLFGKCEFAFIENSHINFYFPIGIAQMKNKDIIVADTFADRLLLFSDKGEFICDIPTREPLIRPSAIVVLPDGNFAVRSNYKISVFEANGSLVCSVGKGDLNKPFGITHDALGNVVTLETKGKDIAIVTIEPQTGTILNYVPVTGAYLAEEKWSSKPRFITFQPPNTLLIVDLGLDRIYIVRLRDGKTLRIIGKKGDGEGEFQDPSGITCDPDGFIMVGDSRNHRIQIFTPVGDFVTYLKVDRPLRRPSGICLTPCGHLLVLNYWEHSLVKYKLINGQSQGSVA